MPRRRKSARRAPQRHRASRKPLGRPHRPTTMRRLSHPPTRGLVSNPCHPRRHLWRRSEDSNRAARTLRRCLRHRPPPAHQRRCHHSSKPTHRKTSRMSLPMVKPNRSCLVRLAVRLPRHTRKGAWMQARGRSQRVPQTVTRLTPHLQPWWLHPSPRLRATAGTRTKL